MQAVSPFFNEKESVMRKSVKRIAMAASMVGAMGMLVAAAPATAADAPQAQVHTYTADSGIDPPAELIGPNGEKPKEWGVATFPADTKGMISPQVKKGGGDWTYGTVDDGWFTKGCYSNYMHNAKRHSATVAIGTNTNKDIKSAGSWAKAYASGGKGLTCHAYWGVY